MQNKKGQILNALGALWLNWALGYGALTLMVVLSIYISPIMNAIGMFVLMILLKAFIRLNRERPVPICSQVLWISSTTLLCTGLVSLCISFMYTHWFKQHFLISESVHNPEVPYVVILLMAPICLTLTIIAYMRMGSSQSCRECKDVFGYNAEDGFIGNVMHNEVRYQIRVLMYIMVFLSTVEWIYNIFFYINININTPDTFFFIIVPLAVYLLSLAFLGTRYAQLSYKIRADKADEAMSSHINHTTIRYIIFRGDYLLLVEKEMKSFDGHTHWDTPVVARLSYRDNVTDEEARRNFVKLTEYDGDFEVRRIFATESFSANANLYHYAIILPENETKLAEITHGEWLDLYAINALYRSGGLSHALTNEINRIYTVTMAWKTYTHEGRRLYPIKNYRPTFRLRDFPTWDVDYDDQHWLRVAAFNQDKPFFTLRRLWYKIFA